MDNEWEAADPMDFGKRKKMMDEYCAKDDDERDTDCYYLTHISGKMVGT